jgi:hypothetical protein
MTGISYEVEEFSDGRWEYTYEVSNFSLSIDSLPVPIKEFTLWFDPGLYANLVVTTSAPLSNAWNEIVWQPEPILQDPGAYDALALVSNPGIGTGQSAKGFSISFDWLGQGTPGSQRYEIINPSTFETIDAGNTIPEPTTLSLLTLGAISLYKSRRR